VKCNISSGGAGLTTKDQRRGSRLADSEQQVPFLMDSVFLFFAWTVFERWSGKW